MKFFNLSHCSNTADISTQRRSGLNLMTGTKSDRACPPQCTKKSITIKVVQ